MSNVFSMNNLRIELRLALAAASLCASAVAAAGGWTDKLDPTLRTQMEAKTASAIPVLITPVVPAKAKLDITALSARTPPLQRPQVIHAALRAEAAATQHDVLDWLTKNGIRYRAFTVVNAVAATLPADRIATLAKRADVLRIDADPVIHQVLPKSEPVQFGKAVTAIELGVSYINADDVWALPGNPRGAGVVVAGQDTGYRWTHNAIKAKYLGWDGAVADHNYHWHDAIHSGGGVCGANAVAPCDDDEHGTHTMGTMVGDDGGTNQVGVAPDAKWIGCRNMDQGNGTPTTYLECFDWFLAPTDLNGLNPDPSKAPHVINNSWGCPTSEGCNSGNWATMQTAIANLTAAGVLVVASAGNGGSGCFTVNDPPAMFAESFSVGNFSASTGALAGSSSRGPVTTDGSGRMKPDIAAPGQSVRSSTGASDSSYDWFSGTSMAGPHVAGAAALVMSAVPGLQREPALVRQFLTQSATAVSSTSCSSAGVPNNLYGSGRLNALAAVQSAQAWWVLNGPVFNNGFE
ncbi:MAG TPA: S8 family serine peptidase [Pseudomonadota bacterium]|nr:S8 family serine peptidase [Pseudomonadota bacterium]